MKIITDKQCTGYLSPAHPERPARVERSVNLLQVQTVVPIHWMTPELCDDAPLLRAHTAEHLARLNQEVDFDADTPYHPGIADHARRSASAGLEALQEARAGESAFSLMRPPGHHATHDQAMGFCYLSNIAIAVLEALATGMQRVAVFDFDAHHGNGTEAVLLNCEGASFHSVHQSPCYPGTGLANVGNNCFNHPVAPSTTREAYRTVLQRAFDAMMAGEPELIAVSAGFDAYTKDPLSDCPLEAEDYYWLGEMINGTGVPTFSLLEGGYSRDLPELILAYLTGLDGL